LIKTLLFSLIMALASYALFQPKAVAETIELVPSSRVVLQITNDMSLDELVRRAYPDEQALWSRIKKKLIETNPTAFMPNSERLITGQRIKLVRVQHIYDQQELESRTPVGYVSALTGEVSARDANGREHPLQIRSAIYEGDRLETKMDASLQVSLSDGAEVFLRQNSVLKVSEYVMTDGYGKESSSVLDLLRGGLRTITGTIGASSTANYQLQTGLATIGIRGTEYVVKLCKQDDCSLDVSRNNPDAKLHAFVLKGAITLTTNDDLQILLARGEYATATSDALMIEPTKSLPPGFLDGAETQQFALTAPREPEQDGENETSSHTWLWIAAIFLLIVGL
jgi:antitoxin component of MazEF toxin-antitoxin module